MKIGILTFHDGINHGGFFQAFSTYTFLKDRGYDVEIINYKNIKHWLGEYRAFLYTKNPAILYQNFKKILKFRADQRAMNLGKFFLNVGRIDKVFDVVVVGSDIVWNYEWDFLGGDQVYFGEGLNSRRWVSYAPSFGSIDGSSTLIPSHVKTGLKKFSHISVRDENSRSIVRRACGREAQIVLDPTFLIDTCGMEKPVNVGGPYILVYAYALRESDVSQTIEFAKRNNLIIVAVGYSQPWADRNVVALGPFEWIGYFSGAAYVLTGTFHGTLFSIKYRRNFITSNNDGISNKTKTILSRIGLMDRLTEGCELFDSLFGNGINYEEVERLLVPLVDESRKFLIKAVENVEEAAEEAGSV